MDSAEDRPQWMPAPTGMVEQPLICLTCFALLPNDERMAVAHVGRHEQQDREERMMRLLGMRLPGRRHHRHREFGPGGPPSTN